MPGLNISRKKFDPAKVQEIISFSGYSSLRSLGAVLHDFVMNIIMNIFLGPIYNAVYSISIRIPNMMKRLFLEPSLSLTPTFTELVAKKDQPRVEMLFILYLKLINLIIFPLGTTLIFLSHPVITAWVGKDFYEAAQVMPYFIVVALMMIPASVCNCVVTAYGAIKLPTCIGLGIAFLNIALSCILGFALKGGLMGIGLATVITNFIGSVIFLPFYACRIGNIKVSKYWIEAILKPLVLTMVVVGGILTWLKGSQGSLNLSLLHGSIYLLVNVSVYILGYFLVATVAEKQQLKELFRSGFSKMTGKGLKINELLLSDKV